MVVEEVDGEGAAGHADCDANDDDDDGSVVAAFLLAAAPIAEEPFLKH